MSIKKCGRLSTLHIKILRAHQLQNWISISRGTAFGWWSSRARRFCVVTALGPCVNRPLSRHLTQDLIQDLSASSSPRQVRHLSTYCNTCNEATPSAPCLHFFVAIAMLAVLRGSAIALLSPLAHHTRCSTSRTASRNLSIDLSPFLATRRRTAGVLGAPESSTFVSSSSSSGSSARFYAAMAFDKIKVENPIVEMDGETPVAVFWSTVSSFLSKSWVVLERLSFEFQVYSVFIKNKSCSSSAAIGLTLH